MSTDSVFFGVSSISQSIINPNPRNFQAYERDSLESQLDRLNFTLASLTKNDENDVLDSFSFQANENIDTDEEFLEKLDDLVLKFERSSMINEDFRSSELRETKKNNKDLKESGKNKENSKQIKEECRLSEIYEIFEQIKGIIFDVENEKNENFIFKVGNTQIMMKVLKDNRFESKESISENFSYHFFENDFVKKENFDSDKNDDKYSFDYDSCSSVPFSDSFSLNYDFSHAYFEKNMHSQINIEIEYNSIKKLNKLKTSAIKELEWECLKTKGLKQNYEKKMKNVEEKEKSLRKFAKDVQSEIEKRIKTFETEKLMQKLEMQKFIEKKLNFLRSFQELKENCKKISYNGDILMNKTNKMIPNNYNCEKPPVFRLRTHSENSQNPENIEQEIKRLEKDIENAAEKGPLLFKLNHLQNKLSTLRSEKILSSPNGPKRLPSFSSSKITTPRAFISKPHHLNFEFANFSTPKLEISQSKTQSSENSFCQSPGYSNRSSLFCDQIEKEENFSKLLEFKENRIKKKEEELQKKENLLQKTWMKMPNANDFFTLVQYERKKLNEKIKIIDEEHSKINLIVSETLQIKKNSQEIEQKNKELMKILEEKRETAEKIVKIVEEFSEFFESSSAH